MRKKRTLVGLFLVACLVGSSLAITLRSSSPSFLYSFNLRGSEVEVFISCSLPETPDVMPRLRIDYSQITPENVREVAGEVFDIEGGEVLEYSIGDYRFYSIGGGGKLLHVYEAGKIFYADAGVETGTAAHPLDFSYEQAEAITDNLMEEMGARGLIPQNPDIQVISGEVGPGGVSIGMIDGERIEVPTSLIRGYKFKFNELDIWPAGVSIEIGEGGGIACIEGFWAGIVEEEENVALIKPAEALERLKSENNWADAPRTLYRKATIEKIDLILYYPPKGPKMGYLLPAFRFTMDLEEESGDHFTFRTAVSAVR